MGNTSTLRYSLQTVAGFDPFDPAVQGDPAFAFGNRKGVSSREGSGCIHTMYDPISQDLGGRRHDGHGLFCIAGLELVGGPRDDVEHTIVKVQILDVGVGPHPIGDPSTPRG